MLEYALRQERCASFIPNHATLAYSSWVLINLASLASGPSICRRAPSTRFLQASMQPFMGLIKQRPVVAEARQREAKILEVNSHLCYGISHIAEFRILTCRRLLQARLQRRAALRYLDRGNHNLGMLQ